MRYPRYKIILALIDFFVLCFSFAVALGFHGVFAVRNLPWYSFLLSWEALFFLLLSGAIILFFQSNNLYKINIVLSRSLQLVVILHSFFYVTIGLAAVAFFFHSGWIADSRSAVGDVGIIGVLGIAGYRLLLFRPLYIYLNENKLISKNVVIVGTNLAAKNLAIQMELDHTYGLHLVGFVDDSLPPKTQVFEKYQLLGSLKDLTAIVEQHNVSEIIVTVSETDHQQLLDIIDICKQTTAQVMVTSSLFDIVSNKVHSERYFNIPVARLTNSVENKGRLFVKRMIDIVGAGIGLLVLAVPFLVIALLIKLTSKGPVFYHQVRVGKDGRQFNFYKFRSMEVGSDKDEGRIKKLRDFIRHGHMAQGGSTKVVNEEMVTPVGRILRKTSMDELPQFINVLKGEMSLVGPRPCLPYEYDAYDEWHKRRLSILPGCTGLWQVSSRSEVGFDDMVLLDLYYIDNFSPWLDLQLILKTVPVMVFGRGGK